MDGRRESSDGPSCWRVFVKRASPFQKKPMSSSPEIRWALRRCEEGVEADAKGTDAVGIRISFCDAA